MNNELKAELAQMAEENRRLDEVVKLLDTAYCFMLHAPAEVEAYGLGGVYTTKNPVGTDDSDWCDRANALIDPPPPAPTTGLLDVVRAAVAWEHLWEKGEKFKLTTDLRTAIQALPPGTLKMLEESR